jgi:hypothetical protein|tara:strand:+ start:41500 stop:42135 length:636 start_codon:yes stop_codon:yes gene_type:complete
MRKSEEVLAKYIPENALDLLMPLLKEDPIELKIKKPRRTKFGDYRFPKKGKRHQISINNNLNPFAFLITLLHEIAHLKAFVEFGNRIKPHGNEWQETFLKITQPFIQEKIFPDNLASVLEKSLKKGGASSCTDLDLFRELQKFEKSPKTSVEEIPEGAIFRADNKMIFKKGAIARKRYKCKCLDNGREYMVHPLAKAELIETPKEEISAKS